jgi:hypothetical protein
MNQDRTPLLTLEHPDLGGYEARVGRDFYGPVPGCDWLEIWDDEGDLVLSVVNRLDPPDERVEAIRLLLVKHGYLAADDLEALTAL